MGVTVFNRIQQRASDTMLNRHRLLWQLKVSLMIRKLRMEWGRVSQVISLRWHTDQDENPCKCCRCGVKCNMCNYSNFNWNYCMGLLSQFCIIAHLLTPVNQSFPPNLHHTWAAVAVFNPACLWPILLTWLSVNTPAFSVQPWHFVLHSWLEFYLTLTLTLYTFSYATQHFRTVSHRAGRREVIQGCGLLRLLRLSCRGWKIQLGVEGVQLAYIAAGS